MTILVNKNEQRTWVAISDDGTLLALNNTIVEVVARNTMEAMHAMLQLGVPHSMFLYFQATDINSKRYKLCTGNISSIQPLT